MALFTFFQATELVTYALLAALAGQENLMALEREIESDTHT